MNSNTHQEPMTQANAGETFGEFAGRVEPVLRQALVARYGVVIGQDATAAAISWAWEHWEVTAKMTNPVGYLYRVGQSSTRPHWAWSRRKVLVFPPELGRNDPTLVADLSEALAGLPHEQRVSVLLVHGHGWSYREVADVLGVSLAAVTNHVHRGVKRLRFLLKDGDV